MNQTNFLIGRGHLLTHSIPPPKRSHDKKQVYSLDEAISRLAPEFESTAASLDELPSEACPGDYGVARMMINPSFIARSFFPAAMLRSLHLESLGSRTVEVTPAKWAKKRPPVSCTTTEFFIAGKRRAFRELNQWTRQIDKESKEAGDLTHVEHFSAFTPDDRVVGPQLSGNEIFEIGLHLHPGELRSFVQQSFESFAKDIGAKIHPDLSFTAGNLWFIPAQCPSDAIHKLAQFTFVRVIRPMPRLRGVRPRPRSGRVKVDCSLPVEQPLSSEPKVAILDGGLPEKHQVQPWLRSYRILDPEADDDPEGPEHGLGVTSAFLFGPIAPGSLASRPYSYVDHLRVLDNDSIFEDPLELYRTLGFVEEVLLSRQYQFVNLSLGPDLPIEDTEVHAWTSVIDELLSDGSTLMTVAVGNNGDLDRESGNARIQVPSDCVNSIAVGASGDTKAGWQRAFYSAIGPGRSPGVVKPDLLAFGGSGANYFHVLSPGTKPELVPEVGTSFAAPYLLRHAVGIRAILGDGLSPLAIKALLIHNAETDGHDKFEVGWGKVPEDLMQTITSPEGVARIVYEGELKPGKYLRAPLPLPDEGLTGKIRLGATFCFASPTDPQDAAAYTRAGLEIVFRPNVGKTKEGQTNADSRGFFDMKKYDTEAERRSDHGKWETVLHSEKNMLGRGLNNPHFDIHYHAREGGASTRRAEKIPYALIITVKAPRHADLFNEILRAYAKTLVPIVPQVSLPIRLR